MTTSGRRPPMPPPPDTPSPAEAQAVAEAALHPKTGARGAVQGSSVKPPSFVRRHATGITVITFLLLGGGLGAAPDVPDWLRPIDLSTAENRQAALDRVFRKPKMTFEAWTETTDDNADDEEAVDEELPPDDEPVAEPPPEELVAEAPAPGETYTRRPYQPNKHALYQRKLAARLKAPGSPIVNPCLKQGPEGCERTALDPFYAALDAVDRKEEGSHATVVTLGNSLIASDHVTDIVRKRLVERFGDGGRGFLLTDRNSKVAGRRVRTGRESKGWQINTFAQKPPKRAHFGFTGSHHETTKKGDYTRWAVRGAERGRLFWLDHKDSSSFRLEADGEVIARLEPTAQTPTDRTFDFDLPEGTKLLKLVADGPEVVIYGVALENDEPGVSWDTIGVPASDAEMYMGTDEGIFTRQLAAREPNLVVLMVGGNETRSLAFKWTTIDEVRRHYANLLDRMKAAAPGAACLAVAPIDAAKATAAGARLTTRPQLLEVVEMEKQVAAEKGCAFFNLFEAMGGKGSLQRFRRAGFVNDDLVHPTGKGGDILGQLFADALLEDWAKTKPPSGELLAKRRLVKPRLAGLQFVAKSREPGAPLPFSRFSDALDLVERKRRGRVAIGQFGDDLTAEQLFTGALRKRFQQRFGEVGFGLVPAAGEEPRLERAAIKRRVIGRTDVLDGRDVVLGGAMGLGGTTLRLSPSARFDLTFCHGCENPTYVTRGFLELGWLYTPDMGRADVLVNNVQVGELSPQTRSRTETDVQYLRIPVRGKAHTISVIVPPDGAGSIHLLSASQELKTAGVVVDSIGLDATTGMTMQRWRQELYGDQVYRRDYDLVVVAWGSREAQLESLDEATYKHHLENTLTTLTEAAPAADCLLMGPVTDEKAPSYSLVTSVQRQLAAKFGCAFFDANAGAKAAEALAKKDETLARLSDDERLAHVLATDLLRWHEYAQAKKADDAQKAKDAADKERITLDPIVVDDAKPGQPEG